ncbi:MAG: sulfotransferase [Alphaproteobacteria bacterium]|nr:sulfotransferase [Alphaproteobacteria bacterium]MCD8563383.1 sulfotransferase [Alphaproteobacteria bacterium]
MTLPAFIIAGASCSGAEILHECLANNPALFFPKGKPSAFFYRNDFYARGIRPYEELFRECDPHRTPGDMGFQYFEHGIVLDENKKYHWQPQEDSALRIKKYCPDAKIILCLRHPLIRAHLQFKQARAGRIEKASTFAVALEEELAQKRSPESHPLCYLYRNNYPAHIAHWKRLFGGENLHIVLYETLMENMAATIARTEEFIGVRPQTPDQALIAQREGKISPGIIKIVAMMDLFPSLKPLQNFILTKSTHKRQTETTGSLPAIPDSLQTQLSARLAEEYKKLESIADLQNLEDLWPLPQNT